MPDAGEIKAIVRIEYDGSGVERAKEDLASLADMAGTFGDSASGISEALSGTVSSISGLSAPLLATTKQLTEASAPMLAITEHAQNMSEQISGANDSFAQIQTSLEKSVPLLPQYAESLKAVGDTVGSGRMAENLAVFQDALVNPEPFSMIQSHLNDTGQSWQDFTAAIGESNAKFLDHMAATSDVTREALGSMSGSAQSIGGVFYESANATEEFTKQFNGLNEAASGAKGINAFGGVGSALYGPEAGVASIGTGEAIGNAFGAIGEGLNKIMMPMFALQMIGMVTSQLASGLYNAAAIAEGPAAHSFGTFTGTVDALGQTMQKTSGAFAEGFGQGIMPTLNALNYQASQSQGGAGNFGDLLGGLGSLLVNLWQLGVSNPVGGFEGLANQYAQLTGHEQPFQGPPPDPTVTLREQLQTQIQQQTAMLQAAPQIIEAQTVQLRVQSTITLEEALDPNYLAAQNQLSRSQQLAQRLQQSYDISHPLSDSQLLADARYQMYVQEHPWPTSTPSYGEQWQQQLGAGNFGGFWQSLSQDFSEWWQGLFGGGQGSGGCFPAGTRVLMADGSERAIETLQVGDQILGHDGVGQVTATILACIVPPPKPVYELRFSDGTRLTLTDSHPIATSQGWKSLNPSATQKENPDLDVGGLRLGDKVSTRKANVELITILPPEDVVQVYNITVDGPHTFYANNILVHNKVNMQLAQQQASFSNIQWPNLDVSGLVANVQSAFSGIQWPSLPDIAGQINSTMSNLFSGIHLPSLPDIANQIGGELGGLFSGIHLPSLPDVADQISTELGGLFSGVHLPSLPDIAGDINSSFGNMFSAIKLPSLPDIAGSINSALVNMLTSIHLPSIPGFAGGVENFGGGAAFIAESGPELVMLPSGSSVYPLSTGSAMGGNITPISLGGGGGSGGPQSINVIVQLDSQAFIQAMGLPLSQSIRLSMGSRSA